MACVYNWVKRHRRKLLFGGAAVGGLLLAGRMLERKLLKDQEDEGRRLLELARKQNHFQATEATCNSSLRRLFQLLRAALCESLDTGPLRAELRGAASGQQLAPERKLAIWEQLKVVAVARNVALVLGGVYLAIFVRLELNLLAGYLFTDRLATSPLLNNNSDPSSETRISAAVQEKYLASCSHFASQGIREFCRDLLPVVEAAVRHISLKQRLSLAEIEGIFLHTLSRLQSEKEEEEQLEPDSNSCDGLNSGSSLFSRASRYLIPATCSGDQLTSGPELDTIKLLFSETLDILDTQEIQFLGERLCRQGFAHAVDKLAEHYTEQTPGGGGEEEEESSSSSSFISPASLSLPLAKLVPLLSGLLTQEEEEEADEWLAHLIDNQDLRTFGANVYESFCQQAAPPFTQPEAETTWLGYLSASVSSWF